MAIIGSGNSLGGISGSNSLARLLVVISGNNAGLEAALAQSEGSIAGFGRNASSIGSILTRSLSLPMLALGGYAVKMASDFQTSLARVAGLTPLLDQTGGSIQNLSDQILALAQDPNINAAPTALADSLYYAGSAGLSAAEAMQVVKLSAEGASIGMGAATDISKVLIFALNNFRSDGLTAASAMDTLTTAIRDGTAAPDEMAIALGRLLPIAHEAGITFNETVASVAALSNLGVPTRVATTSLRALFSELLAPTIAATQKLNELGISAEQLAHTLAVGGPVAAFDLLTNAVHGNEQSLHDIIPQIRGFTAFLGLTGDNAKSYAQILDDARHSTGVFGEALDKIVHTPAFQFQKGLQSLQIAGIELGQKLMPVFLRLSQVLQDFGNIIAALPGPVLTFVAALITIGAAAGPVLQLYGALTQTKTAMNVSGQAVQTSIPTWKAFGSQLLVVGIAAGVAYGALHSLVDGTGNLGSVITGTIATFIALRVAMIAIQGAADAGALGVNALSLGIVGLSSTAVTAAAVGLAALIVGITWLIGNNARAAASFKQMSEALLSGAKAGETFATSIANIKDNGLRQTFQELERINNVSQKPTAIALPTIATDAADQLISKLKTLQALSVNTSLDDAGKQLAPFIAAAQTAAIKGESLSKAFSDVGLSYKTYLDLLGKFGRSVDFSSTVDSVHNLDAALLSAIQSDAEYQRATQATIQFKQLDTQATQALADKYGVSVDFISSKLSEYGIAAAGMSADTENTFTTAVGIVDKSTGEIIGHAAEVQQALAAQTKTLTDSLSQSFNLFGDLPSKAAAPIDKTIAKAKQLSDVMVQQTQNIVQLQKAGVPTGLITQLQNAGPAMVAKFANGTKGQLRQLVTAYEVGLGAMDDTILKEGAHQEVKGKNMVQGFTTAILSNSRLPAGAAKKIMSTVTQAFGSGKLSAKGLQAIQQFATGLGHVNIAKAAAAKATRYVAQQMIAGNGFNKAGKLQVQKLATGLAENANIPKAKAKALVDSISQTITKEGDQKVLPAAHHISTQVTTGLGSENGADKTTGTQAGAAFAAGLTSAQAAAYNAALGVARRAKQGFIDGSKNSPELFTYYLGKRIMDDYYRGIGERSNQLKMRAPFAASFDMGNSLNRRGPGYSSSHSEDKHDHKTKVDVRLERRNFSRGLDHEYSGRGR